MGAGGTMLDWEGVAAPLPALTATAAAACGALEALLTVGVNPQRTFRFGASLRSLEHLRASASRKLASVTASL
jgi:hypothetical protein